jgi:hypothetical protein
MQPRSIAGDLRILSMERMTLSINSWTLWGHPLAKARLAKDQTPSSGLSSGA